VARPRFLSQMSFFFNILFELDVIVARTRMYSHAQQPLCGPQGQWTYTDQRRLATVLEVGLVVLTQAQTANPQALLNRAFYKGRFTAGRYGGMARPERSCERRVQIWSL
jgi:hypothetical protein